MSELLTIEQQPGITLEKIEVLEGRMLRADNQVELPVMHHFAPGVCVREIFMPAGSMVLGHKHRFPMMNIMLTGRISLLNDDGTTTMLTAPQTFCGTAWRKIAFVHEDCRWQNVIPTTETDIEKIEELAVEKSATFLEHESLVKQLESKFQEREMICHSQQ
jgi:hypothetical protein